MVDSRHASLSIARQCELVAISRSGFYYQPTGETELNLTLMRLIDERHLKAPYYGATSSSTGRTKCGARTSRISRCGAAFCTWWRSWTGRAAR